MPISTEAKAFILVIAAGLCTTIGAAVVFFPRLAHLANPTCLAISLGLAAGVMLYIAMVDIYTKAIDGFATVHDEDKSFIWATLSFFLGSVIMLLLDWCVDKLLAWEMKRTGMEGQEAAVAGLVTGLAETPAEDLERMRDQFEIKVAEEKGPRGIAANTIENDNGDDDVEVTKLATNDTNEKLTEDGSSSQQVVSETLQPQNAQPLRQMGFAMALAVAIHNFPEGMVTYLAYVEEPAVGVALAIGIAIHNIPEGLCVAMPLYYATGRRWYSFMWGTVSGLTEPLGALLVWLVLRGDLGGNANGLLFGIVAGMMTVISVQELLPNAHKYAKNNGSIVTYSFLFGAFLIAASLMLFSV